MTDELPSYRIASGKCCIRSDGYRAIGAATDTPRGGRRRLSDAIVAKCASLHHFGRTQSLAVETRRHADQVNESVFEGRFSVVLSFRRISTVFNSPIGSPSPSLVLLFSDALADGLGQGLSRRHWRNKSLNLSKPDELASAGLANLKTSYRG